MPSYDMTGSTLSAYQDGAMNARIMEVGQYLMQEPPLYPGMNLPSDGLPYMMDGSDMTQHVDPAATQVNMDYEPSFSGNSPHHSWDSCSSGSPVSSAEILDDTWSLGLASSPTESHATSSPNLQGQSPRYVAIESPPSPLPVSYMEDVFRAHRKYALHMMAGDQTGLLMSAEDAVLPPPLGSRRSSGEGESGREARDHPLYKQVQPHPDGLFHCPWEGQASCNHKPEKLKCNYE